VAIAAASVVCAASFLFFIYTAYIIPWLVIAGPQMAAAVAVALIPVKTAFVSYRRADGRDVAVFIANELNRMGIEAFIDIKEHNSGRLSAVLFPQIIKRQNFILILTPGVIERWKPGQGDEKDWIGQEMERAVALNKTVVLVTVNDVGSFIETYSASHNNRLPEEVRQILANYKRTSYSSDQPDASIETIARNLRSCTRRA